MEVPDSNVLTIGRPICNPTFACKGGNAPMPFLGRVECAILLCAVYSPLHSLSGIPFLGTSTREGFVRRSEVRGCVFLNVRIRTNRVKRYYPRRLQYARPLRMDRALYRDDSVVWCTEGYLCKARIVPPMFETCGAFSSALKVATLAQGPASHSSRMGKTKGFAPLSVAFPGLDACFFSGLSVPSDSMPARPQKETRHRRLALALQCQRVIGPQMILPICAQRATDFLVPFVTREQGP